MKSKLSALVVLMLGLSLGNCDLLGVSLIDKDDFSIKDFKPSPSAKFIKGLKFSQEDVANELLGTGEDADLEIPLLGDALKSAGAPGGLIILAKEVEYGGDYKWQLAALIKIDGDKLQYKNQKFPAASGKGNYGMFFADTKYAFVTGKAVDCDGKAKAGIWAISGNEHNYLTKTDSKGKYGLPFEVGKAGEADGKSISLSIADEDCGGGAAVSVPMNPAGDDTVVEKDQDGDGTTDPSDCSMGAANGGDETVTEAPDAPPLRDAPADGDRVTPSGNVCDDFKIVILDGAHDAPVTVAEATTATAACIGTTELAISTGGKGNAGTGAALDFDPSTTKSITVEYSVLSQEYPQYAIGAFNDAIGFGFVGANSPGHVDSVGVLQASKTMIWNFDTNTCSNTNKCGYSNITSADEVAGSFAAGLVLNDSDDSTKNNSAHGGSTRFGGVTALKDAAAETFNNKQTATIPVPGNVARQSTATFLVAIGDVGDKLFDSAIVIHSVTLNAN